ncbi:MAG: wax ester/triacylglycerol synthase family O-acyltransferase [Acidimicrobiia bacterium]|nr:wax ester/triacylglycerol synthase family O-acyltransferase [Acidimicrobiia bacterium]
MRRLNGLDAAFLAAETRTSPLHIGAVLLLDPSTVPGGYSFGGLRAFVGDRLHLVPPLQRRLVEVPLGLGGPVWVEERDLDVDRHLRRAAVPAPGGRRELGALVADLFSRPLDRARPLWEMHVVEGLEGGRVAVVAKVHHALMDGMAGVEHMASFFSLGPEVPAPSPTPGPPPDRVPGPLEMLAGALPGLALTPLRGTRALAGLGLAALRGLGAPRRDALHVPSTVFNEAITSRRGVAFTRLGLDDVKAVRRTFGVTVNDVVLAVVAGAVRRHLQDRGELPAAPLVTAMPAAVQLEGADNAVTVLRSTLATDLADPVARLRRIHVDAAEAKAGGERSGPGFLVDLTGAATPALVHTLARLYTGLRLAERLPPLCNLLVSNVPGTPVPLYFGGARLLDLLPLGPIFDGVGLNVTVISCEDHLDVGLVACPDRVADLWPLADALGDELAALATAAHDAP